MIAFETWGAFCQRTRLALPHSLWQGADIALVTALRRRNLDATARRCMMFRDSLELHAVDSAGNSSCRIKWRSSPRANSA